MSPYQLNSKNSGLALSLKTIFNSSLSYVSTDGKYGNGLKLEKVSSKITPKNVVVSSP